MKTKIFSLFSLSVFAASSAFAVDTFFFTGSDSGVNDANDRSQWVQLSSYNSSGDTFLFKLFPTGTDDRLSADKGNNPAGVIAADQSNPITAETDVVFNRYTLGELQSDGSVAFGSVVKEARPIVFSSDFTARNMRMRINDNATFQFAGTGDVTLSFQQMQFDYISRMYLTKTTANTANLNVAGDFIVKGGNRVDLGSADGFMDNVNVGAFRVCEDSNVAFNVYARKVDAASLTLVNSDASKVSTLSLFVGALDVGDASFYFGTAKKAADSVINVDFSYLDAGAVGAGEYKIFSVDSWSEGFAESGSLADFNINDDILNAMGIEHSFDWDGQNLVLNVAVPEPAAFAALFGVVAFAFAARRGRK